MTDPAVEKLASILIEYSKKIFNNKTAYRLDFTTPSLPTLDIILSTHAAPRQASPLDKELVNGVAAYIGIMAYAAWKISTPSATVKLLLRTEPEPEIILEATDTTDNKDSNLLASIALVKTITGIIENPADPFHFFSNFAAPVHGKMQIITLFAKGLLSGLSPFCKGHWKSLAVESFTTELSRIMNLLAFGASEHMSFRFSQNRFFKDPGFFKDVLILPPPGYDESFPYIRNTSFIIKKLKDLEATTKEIEQTCLHLLCSLDNSYNATGFIIASALSIPGLDNFILAYAASNYHIVRHLRPAVHVAKKLFGLPDDWILEHHNKDYQSAASILHHEYRYGLLPLISQYPSIEFLNAPPLLIENLATGTLREAKKACDTYKSIGIPLYQEWIELQDLYLDCLDYVDASDSFNRHTTLSPLLKPSYIRIGLELSLFHKNSTTLLHFSNLFFDFLENETSPDQTGSNEMHLLFKISAFILDKGSEEHKIQLKDRILSLLKKYPALLYPELYGLWNEYHVSREESFPKIHKATLFMLNRAYWSPLTAFMEDLPQQS